MIKMYYSPELNVAEEFRIIPPPKISIRQNLNYANDQVIGYTYTIDFNGYATNYIAIYDDVIVGGAPFPGEGESGGGDGGDVGGGEDPPGSGVMNYGIIQTEDSIDINSENDITLITENTLLSQQINTSNISSVNSVNLAQVLFHIEKIRYIFSLNGNTLTIRDEQNNDLLVARGGVLKSLSFDQSPNAWTRYSTYTASIEFNDLMVIDDNFNCSTLYTYTNAISSGLVDISKYKITSFSDDWSIDLEDDSLNFYRHNKDNVNLTSENTRINLSYSLSAVGKNYYVQDEVYPAWLQAKNFVQDRLYQQIRNLDKVLNMNGQYCESSGTLLKNLHDIDVASSGLIKDVMTSQSGFRIFNEKVTCETSESEGSFSINYTAILKKKEDDLPFASGNVIHTFNKEYSINKEGTRSIATITINGNIEGLCEGGLVNSGGNFILPQNGTLLLSESNNTKFKNAEKFLEDKIIDINDDNLKVAFYSGLGVTLSELLIDSGIVNMSCMAVSGKIPAASFNLTKNFMEGTISYSASYNTTRACSKEFGPSSLNKTTISVDVPVPIIAEFSVPGGEYIIQDIGTVSARRVSISSQGKIPRNCCLTTIGSGLLQAYCNLTLEQFLPFVVFPNANLYTLTTKQYTTDPIQGTYSFNLNYICNSGCQI